MTVNEVYLPCTTRSMATLVLKILHSKKHETLKKKTKEIIELKFQYTIRIQKAGSDISRRL